MRDGRGLSRVMRVRVNRCDFRRCFEGRTDGLANRGVKEKKVKNVAHNFDLSTWVSSPFPSSSLKFNNIISQEHLVSLRL